MPTEIVPFGKYKGQPIETLQQDRAYCDWLVGQDWLQTRFPELRTIIVNNFGEATETPEHNALQARALEIKFVLGVIYLAQPKLKKKNSIEIGKQVEVVFESQGMDVMIAAPNGMEITITRDDEPEFSTHLQNVLSYLEGQLRRAYTNNEIEETKAEIEKYKTAIGLKHWISFDRIGIELKPTLGDDYPAVIRQIKASKFFGGGIPVVVIGSYNGIGATLDQVSRMFEASGIRFLTVSEIEKMTATLQ
jgi:hypothetical protein